MARKNGVKRSVDLNKSILILAAIAVAAVALLFVAAAVFGLGSNVAQEPGDDNIPGIFPSDSNKTDTMAVKLYFAYADRYLLAPETRLVTAVGDERMEYAVLRELIKGPDVTRAQLSGLCNTSTRIIDIYDQGDTLFVTFDAALLSKPLDRYNLEDVNRRARLMIESIVNTLLGMGRYSNVQILIDEDKTGIGQQVALKHYGYYVGESMGNALMGIKSFNSGVVLSPETTLELLIDACQNGDWQSVHGFMTQTDEWGTRPTADAMRASFTNLDNALSGYEITGFDVSADGKSMLYWLDVDYVAVDGRKRHRSNFPLKLHSENELWKVGFSNVEKLLIFE